MFQRVRLTASDQERLQQIAASLVRPEDRHPNQRADSSLVAPLIRLIAHGQVIPVRLPDNLDVLERAIHAHVGGVKLTDPDMAGVALSQLLALLASRKLRLVRG